MPGIKELKNRIKSVQSTRKITRAMQMVAAAKMRKSQQAALQSRSYADLAWEMVRDLAPVIPENLSASENLSGIPDSGHNTYPDPGSRAGMTRLLQAYPNAKKSAVIIVSTNKGLVGSLNTNLLSRLKEFEKQSFVPEEKNNNEIEIITLGKKGNLSLSRLKKNVVADFPKPERQISSEDIYSLAGMITTMYETGQYRKIYLLYNKFVSTLVQKSEVKQLLPFTNFSLKTETVPESLQKREDDIPQVFEPTPQKVLNHLLPRIVESQVYEAVLESDASEHSARMVMMKNATEAAGDLISDYTLTYNQLRQNKITTELAEITAGRIALE